jgi:hypothetical protein
MQIIYMRDLIEKRLQPILGAPVWAAGRASRMLWIQIGKRHSVAAWGGGTKEVGTFALHIDCPWTWTQDNRLIADQDSELDALGRHLQSPVVCQSIVSTGNGSFEMTFTDRSTLTVTVEAGRDCGEDEEYWRFFSPVTDAPHFVVGSNGIRK